MFMDHALSRRLERAEGALGFTFTEARNRVTPGANAWARDFDGTYAVFDGLDSPMNQTFGLGLFGATTAEQLAEIEGVFAASGSTTQHEVSPLAGAATAQLLVGRGYHPIELTTILVQPITGAPVVAPAGLAVRIIDPVIDHDRFVDASVRGWSSDPAFAEVIRALATVGVANPAMTELVVEADGAIIATGSLGIHDGVALLAGASTIPEGRGRGAQGLLLAARLAEAHRRGCDLALMGTEPGSGSQRNAQRRGFAVAYTRTKWALRHGAASSSAAAAQ